MIALPISYRSPSTTGRYLARFTLQIRSTSCYSGNPEIFFACRSGNGYLFDSNIRQLPELPQAWLSVNRSSFESGFWAVTQTTSTGSVRLSAVEGAVFTQEESEGIRGEFLDHYVSTRPDFAPMASHIRAADGVLTTPVFGGYLHNAISIVSLVALVACTAIQRPWRWLRRTPRPGTCVRCKYDLSGTPIDSRCPECGTEPGYATAS